MVSHNHKARDLARREQTFRENEMKLEKSTFP